VSRTSQSTILHKDLRPLSEMLLSEEKGKVGSFPEVANIIGVNGGHYSLG
jgi:hypothetical protein